jgi:hypothetical protein
MALRVSAVIERADIVRLLAKASHETWMRQKEREQIVPREQLPVEVTDYDLEQAEDAVRVLEEHGLLRTTRGRPRCEAWTRNGEPCPRGGALEQRSLWLCHQHAQIADRDPAAARLWRQKQRDAGE